MDATPENPLSDDMTRWPSSPYELLGISRTDTRKDVRRAYSQLIRRFRPETHPQHFQKIREAFEFVLSVVDLNLQVDDSGHIGFHANWQNSNSDDDGSAFVSDRAGSAAGRSFQMQHHDGNDRFEQIWERFSTVPNRSQYAELQAELIDECRTAERCLIGYWMLRLRPDFSPDEHPAEWLKRGLLFHSNDWRLVDLFSEECERNHSLTETSFSGEISGQIQNIQLLYNFLTRRWTILARLQRWSQIEKEKSLSGPRFAYEHSEVWFHLLIQICELTVFSRNPTAVKICRSSLEEINDLSRLFPRQFGQLETLDMLSALAATPPNYLTADAQKLLELIRDAKVTGPDSFRIRLFDVVEAWITSPSEGLEAITQLGQKYPEAVWFLLRLVSEAGFFSVDSDEYPEQFDPFTVLAKTCDRQPYELTRLMVVEFCRDECLSGTEILEFVQNPRVASAASQQLAEAMSRDTPLLLTCQLIWQFLKAFPEKQNQPIP